MKKREVIKKFLLANTYDDLASLYNPSMEVQVNVAQDNGTKVTGEYLGRNWIGWSDGISTWKPFRVPFSANSEPHYNDSELTFDFDSHVEGIGMTGWDWENKQSRWVAYDFDAITGHSEKHTKKLSDTELEEVKEKLKALPFLTLRSSTSGKGLHLYIHLNESEQTKTVNHNEHAALARAILHQLCALLAYDFVSRVDVCGGNMWVWHRKMKGTDGLKIIKKGENYTVPPDLDWKQHLTVTERKRKKLSPSFINESIDVFEQLSGQNSKIPLDNEHQKLINYLNNGSCKWWWEADHHMLIAHTYDLKAAHTALGFKGVFETISKGDEQGFDHNMFAFPMKNGGWVVRRYTKGTAEAPTWETDNNGWTKCYYNKNIDLPTASRVNNGIEHPNGGYVFKYTEDAIKALSMLGVKIELPMWTYGRSARIKSIKNGEKIVIEITAEAQDENLSGWLNEKGLWKRVLVYGSSEPIEPDRNYDDIIRHLITPSGEDYGWAVKSEGHWKIEPLSHIKIAIQSLGFNGKDVNCILGSAIFKAWTIVNYPFQPEYPGDRKWNKDAPQLKFVPKTDLDSATISNLSIPTWDRILKHTGKGLDDSIANNEWCRINGISSGADYLKCWITSLIKEPEQPLPYLFFYGPQGSGKSIFHEALTTLFSKGIVRADSALVSGSGFNGELEHAIVCVIEETDLRKNKGAYNRIKDWVTSPQLAIHKKQRTPYSIPNTTHYIHCANDSDACPIFPGDTRIVMIYVDDLPPDTRCSKKDMMIGLTKEAQDFLTILHAIELPLTNDRLNLPVVTTNEKLLAENFNKTMLEIFFDEKVYYKPGHVIRFSEFYEKYLDWLDPNLHHEWSKIRVGREIKPPYFKGRSTKENSQFFIGNASFNENVEPKDKLILVNNFLVPERKSNGQSPPS